MVLLPNNIQRNWGKNKVKGAQNALEYLLQQRLYNAEK